MWKIDLAQRYQIQGVPKTIINEQHSFVGTLPEPHMLLAMNQCMARSM